MYVGSRRMTSPRSWQTLALGGDSFGRLVAGSRQTRVTRGRGWAKGPVPARLVTRQALPRWPTAYVCSRARSLTYPVTTHLRARRLFGRICSRGPLDTPRAGLDRAQLLPDASAVCRRHSVTFCAPVRARSTGRVPDQLAAITCVSSLVVTRSWV